MTNSTRYNNTLVDEYYRGFKEGEKECITTLDKAPEWDGHTSDDVLERLKGLYK